MTASRPSDTSPPIDQVLAQVGAGWRSLLLDIDVEARRGGGAVLGAKEKFAELRVTARVVGERMRGAISMAEAVSTRICEECGGAGERRGDHWIQTLCVRHVRTASDLAEAEDELADEAPVRGRGEPVDEIAEVDAAERRRLVAEGDINDLFRVVRSPGTDGATVQRAWERQRGANPVGAPSQRAWIDATIAAAPGCTPEMLRTMIRDGGAEVRLAVARRADAPPDLLAALARDPDALVRWGVARSAAADTAVLDAVAAGDDLPTALRVDLARAERAGAALLTRLAGDDMPAVRDWALRHPRCPERVWRAAAAGGDPGVAVAVAERGGLDAEAAVLLLAVATQPGDEPWRGWLAGRMLALIDREWTAGRWTPDAPWLAGLMAHQNLEVREWAGRRLARGRRR